MEVSKIITILLLVSLISTVVYSLDPTLELRIIPCTDTSNYAACDSSRKYTYDTNDTIKLGLYYWCFDGNDPSNGYILLRPTYSDDHGYSNSYYHAWGKSGITMTCDSSSHEDYCNSNCYFTSYELSSEGHGISNGTITWGWGSPNVIDYFNIDTIGGGNCCDTEDCSGYGGSCPGTSITITDYSDVQAIAHFQPWTIWEPLMNHSLWQMSKYGGGPAIMSMIKQYFDNQYLTQQARDAIAEFVCWSSETTCQEDNDFFLINYPNQDYRAGSTFANLTKWLQYNLTKCRDISLDTYDYSTVKAKVQNRTPVIVAMNKFDTSGSIITPTILMGFGNETEARWQIIDGQQGKREITNTQFNNRIQPTYGFINFNCQPIINISFNGGTGSNPRSVYIDDTFQAYVSQSNVYSPNGSSFDETSDGIWESTNITWNSFHDMSTAKNLYDGGYVCGENLTPESYSTLTAQICGKVQCDTGIATYEVLCKQSGESCDDDNEAHKSCQCCHNGNTATCDDGTCYSPSTTASITAGTTSSFDDDLDNDLIAYSYEEIAVTATSSSVDTTGDYAISASCWDYKDVIDDLGYDDRFDVCFSEAEVSIGCDIACPDADPIDQPWYTDLVINSSEHLNATIKLFVVSVPTNFPYQFMINDTDYTNLTWNEPYVEAIINGTDDDLDINNDFFIDNTHIFQLTAKHSINVTDEPGARIEYACWSNDSYRLTWEQCYSLKNLPCLLGCPGAIYYEKDWTSNFNITMSNATNGAVQVNISLKVGTEGEDWYDWEYDKTLTWITPNITVVIQPTIFDDDVDDSYTTAVGGSICLNVSNSSALSLDNPIGYAYWDTYNCINDNGTYDNVSWDIIHTETGWPAIVCINSTCIPSEKNIHSAKSKNVTIKLCNEDDSLCEQKSIILDYINQKPLYNFLTLESDNLTDSRVRVDNASWFGFTWNTSSTQIEGRYTKYMCWNATVDGILIARECYVNNSVINTSDNFVACNSMCNASEWRYNASRGLMLNDTFRFNYNSSYGSPFVIIRSIIQDNLYEHSVLYGEWEGGTFAGYFHNCNNGIKDNYESAIDYGGPCGSCDDGSLSPLIGEVDVDYGGKCGYCITPPNKQLDSLWQIIDKNRLDIDVYVNSEIYPNSKYCQESEGVISSTIFFMLLLIIAVIVGMIIVLVTMVILPYFFLFRNVYSYIKRKKNTK